MELQTEVHVVKGDVEILGVQSADERLEVRVGDLLFAEEEALVVRVARVVEEELVPPRRRSAGRR